MGNIKFAKSQMPKMTQLEGSLDKLLEPLIKAGLPLIEDVLKSLAKSVLVHLRLTAAVSATDAAIKNNIFVSRRTTLIFSNKKLNDIMKVIESL